MRLIGWIAGLILVAFEATGFRLGIQGPQRLLRDTRRPVLRAM